jgi:hypothetical protein
MFTAVTTMSQQIAIELNEAKLEEERTKAITKIILKLMRKIIGC